MVFWRVFSAAEVVGSGATSATQAWLLEKVRVRRSSWPILVSVTVAHQCQGE